jgi:hypothetical protein
MRAVVAVALGAVAALQLGCTTGDADGDAGSARATTSTRPTETDAAVPRVTTRGAATQTRTTVTCTFADLVGVVVIPDKRRIEILETDQEFAGDTGLPPTGTGKTIAALTRTGLTTGERCRLAAPLAQEPAVRDSTSPYPERYPTWLRCYRYGTVLIDAKPSRSGYRLTIGDRGNASVSALLLPNGRGHIRFSVPGCRRFVVTDNVIP